MSDNVGEYGAQDGDIVMPFYVVCDVSGSMSHDIADLQSALKMLQQDVMDYPVVADLTRIGIITFSTDAEEVVPLGTLDSASIPTLSAHGATNYGAAFQALRSAIDKDRATLKGQGYKLFRPCAFFLTDGAPTDADWEAEFVRQFHFDEGSKAGNIAYPRFIPFGFRNASLDVLSRLAYPAKGGRAFVQRDGATVTTALRSVREFVAQTIINTGMSAPSGGGQPSHAVANQAEGFDSAPSQYAGGDWL